MHIFFLEKLGKEAHKPITMIFHTIEFLIFVIILSLYFNFVLFILIGILFHSTLDLIDLYKKKMIKCREFSLIRYLVLRRKYPEKYY